MGTRLTPPSDSRKGSPRVPPKRPGTRPTIRAVAERAEVAISTVSRVVNGGSVSAVVQRRVTKAIEELGYIPSIAAQSLVGGRSGCIGLVVNSTQSPWFNQVLLGIESALAPSRKSVLLASLLLTGEYDPLPVRAWINENRVDGLIFVRSTQLDVELLAHARAAHVPVVLIGPDVDEPESFTVRGNNLHAGRLAAQHLHALGHRRVGFAGGPQASRDTRMRLLGVKEYLSEQGCPLSNDLLWYGDRYTPEAGIKHGQAFLALARTRRPSAMIIGNDSMALGFMRTVLGAGLTVPGDVSVVGFDGIPDGELFWPSLTTIRQPTQQMAAHACGALLTTIGSPDKQSMTATEFPVELVARESTRAI